MGPGPCRKGWVHDEGGPGPRKKGRVHDEGGAWSMWVLVPL